MTDNSWFNRPVKDGTKGGNKSLCAKAVLIGALYSMSAETVRAADVASELQSESQMGAEAEAMVDTEMEAEADADSSIQSFSESQIQAEAMAQVQMVTEQEHELQQREQMDNQQSNKFIEVISDSDNDIVDAAKKEVLIQKPKKEFKANVYDSYDANTGLKIEEQTVDTLSQSAIKEAETQQKKAGESEP